MDQGKKSVDVVEISVHKSRQQIRRRYRDEGRATLFAFETGVNDGRRRVQQDSRIEDGWLRLCHVNDIVFDRGSAPWPNASILNDRIG